MTLRLTPEALAAAYDYLRTTAPFDRWNLPESEDVVFRVTKTPHVRGRYLFESGRHVIEASTRCLGHTLSVMALMAHEMVHLHQRHVCMETPGAEHNAAFHKIAGQVCRVHGFDERLF